VPVTTSGAGATASRGRHQHLHGCVLCYRKARAIVEFVELTWCIDRAAQTSSKVGTNGLVDVVTRGGTML